MPHEPKPAGPSPITETLPPAVIERVADRFRMLGDPTRLRLVNSLHAHGELTVGDLVASVGLSYGAVSKQLSLLRSYGIVTKRREANRIHYRIADPSLSELCDVTCRGLREDWAGWGSELERDFSRSV